jgi:hypothetical protein
MRFFILVFVFDPFLFFRFLFLFFRWRFVIVSLLGLERRFWLSLFSFPTTGWRGSWSFMLILFSFPSFRW